MFDRSVLCLILFADTSYPDWEEAFANVRETLGLSPDTPVPPIPGQASTQPSVTQSSMTSQATGKRKTTDGESDTEMDGSRDDSKRTRTEGESEPTTVQKPSAAADSARLHAQTAASFIPFLQTEHLLPPKMPSHDEMETILLQLRKKALVEEYFGDGK
jgi:pre-mRNA-splicing factor ISY1